jgi:hypothetical protein
LDQIIDGQNVMIIRCCHSKQISDKLIKPGIKAKELILIVTILGIRGLQSPRQTDYTAFTLGLRVANSAPLSTGKKVANHSP